MDAKIMEALVVKALGDVDLGTFLSVLVPSDGDTLLYVKVSDGVWRNCDVEGGKSLRATTLATALTRFNAVWSLS